MKTFLISLILLISLSYPAVTQTLYSNLPTLYITTNNSQAVADKVNWVPGNILVASNDTTERLNIATEIRGRGNSTWNLAKKPYRIKLSSKTHLLNLPANAKNWVLLANYADKTLIRNAVAFKISELLGFEFTPSARFVDLNLNGEFLGNYMVTDQMEVGSKRVNIVEQDSTDITEPNITGGYFLEIDGFASGEPVWFTTEKGLKITVKSPNDAVINQYQLDYIKNYIGDFETRLFSTDFTDPIKGYRAKVDTTTLINWYIASELTGNSDAFWSTYIYKKRLDDKLYFGPLWDYDIAFNNDSRLGDTSNKLMRQYAFNPRTWIERLSQDEWFLNAVWRRWQILTSTNLLGTLTSYINTTTALIDQSQQKNFQQWNNLSSRVYLENYLFSTYGAGVDYLKTYLTNRIAFLTTSFANVEPVKPSEPFVTSNNYYMISNKRTNNVVCISGSSVLANASLVMWAPIEENDNQLWKIISLGNDLYRFVNKNSGLAMAGNGKNTNLIQVPVNLNDESQKWKITPVNTGNVYGILNNKSTYAVDNSGGSFANGTKAIEWDNNITSNENQQWYLQRMSEITGLQDNVVLNQRVELYSNPTASQITLRFETNTPEDLSISIYDITGDLKYLSKMKMIQIGNQVVSISVSDYQVGMYFIKISDQNGKNKTLKFIKR
jgi:hypothetical protein